MSRDRGIPLIHRELWEGSIHVIIFTLELCYFLIFQFLLTIPNVTSFQGLILKRAFSQETVAPDNKPKGKPTKPQIWVYDINSLSLVKGAPFKNKSICGTTLGINRHSVANYLDTEKVFNNKCIFSSSILSKEELSKWVISTTVKDALVGDMLGDGHISRGDISKYPNINARLQFTFSVQNLPYLRYLKFVVYASICTLTEPTPWPNPELTGKKVTQYSFSSKQLPMFTELHKIWYKIFDGKFVKVLPSNIEELLKPIGLAHWIMGDGYWDNVSLKLCTDNFTKEEVLILVNILNKKFDLKASINKRTSDNGNVCWRIRISNSSINNLRSLVSPFFIPEMLYKLGIKKNEIGKDAK